jgi:glycosyltransferase involved in cell wall biosynthesis
MKKISIVVPCFNEESNVDALYSRLVKVTALENRYAYEIIFIDNASEDSTVEKLKVLANQDERLKIIINTRNFGHIRSPYWGLMQTCGDAAIIIAADLQDPPELIPKFIKEWELGWRVILAQKPNSKTGLVMHNLRKFYYHLLNKLSDVNIVKNATGFGLYDRMFIDQLIGMSDPYPFIRGLACELGLPLKTVSFEQPKRAGGSSKNNFYTLFDIAMLGIVSHSLVPLRLSTILGFLIGLLSIGAAIMLFIMKILNWDGFILGIAPIAIGMFFMFGILFILIGLLGEYIAVILRHVRKRPIVVEKERINF